MYYSWKALSKSHLEKHINDMIQNIDTFREKKENLWSFLGELNRNELIAHSLPFNWYIREDKKNNKVYTNYISVPTFGLYDVQVYFQTKPEHKPIKQKYIKYISNVLNTCLGKNHKLNAEDVFEIEYQMIMAFDCDIKESYTDINDAINNSYNRVTVEDGIKKYNFDWKKFSKGIGYTNPPPFFIAANLNYLKCMSNILIDNWNNEQWRTYWIFIQLSQMIRFHSSWRSIYYDYYERDLAGQNAIFPSEIYPIFGLSCAFNNFLTKAYVKKNHRKDYIEYTEKMANSLRSIFIMRIKKNKWLTEKTKQYALKKISKLNLQIYENKNMLQDAVLTYDKKDVWGNMIKLFHWRTKHFVNLNNKPIMDIPEIDWKLFKLIGTQTYVVNAYYMPSFNRVFIPLAYLQKPFIDLEDSSFEYNLANLGFTIAHEFSHSLDVIGSKYDYNGNLYNWWTKEDRKNYLLMVKDINNQYKQFMGYDNLSPDVNLYIGENIADITGLSLCNDYLILYNAMKNNLESVSTTFLSLKTFYNFYAIQMRQHLSDDSLNLLLKTNPHPPDKYRINCPLARLNMFQLIFGIQKTDKMYWNKDKQIW